MEENITSVFAGDHREHGGAAAFVRHVLNVGARLQLEQFAGQMLEAADAGGGVIELAGLRLGVGEQFLRRMHRQFRIDGEHIGAGGEDRDRHEILHRVERLLVEPRIDRMRDRDDEERVAVGRGLGGEIGADHAAGAGAIVDEDLLAEVLAELVGDDAADDVVAAAGRERDDQADRSGWGSRRRTRRGARREARAGSAACRQIL